MPGLPLPNVSDGLGWLAGALTVAAFIPYVRSILYGITRPNRASWFIWTLVCAVTALTYAASGARSTMWVAYAYVGMTFMIAALSIRFGDRSVTALDWLCLVGALVSLVPWLAFRNAPVSLYIGIAIDLLAALPTIRKAFLIPKSEDRFAWSISAAAMTVNLLAIDDWRASISAYPIYCFLMVGGITATLYLRGHIVHAEIV